MKAITVMRDGKMERIPILYSIFDVTNGLLEENYETEAKNATDAIKKYRPDLKVKRDGSKYAEICVSTFFMEDGTRYKYGRRTWYRIL